MSNREIILHIILNLAMLGVAIYDVYLGVKKKQNYYYVFAFISFAIFTTWTYGFIKQLYGV